MNMWLFSVFKNFNWHRKNTLEAGVNNSVLRHKAVLDKLEKYDRGEIQKPQDLARYSSVQEYLQDIQKSPSDVPLGRRATPTICD